MAATYPTRRPSSLATWGLLPLLLLAPALALAQPAFEVKDLNPSTANGGTGFSFSGTEFVEMGGLVLFTVDDGIHGTELWRTDGTAAGTLLVKDICPGVCASTPSSLTVVGGTLFFGADDGAHGRELWKSDGTEAGTVLVKDILPGLGGSAPYWLSVVNGTLLFAADDGIHGRELWTSDGTAAGTALFADLNPGAGGSFVAVLATVGTTLFFIADDGVHGDEPWKTDGTFAGTALVKDINPGPGGSIFQSSLLPGFRVAAAAGGKLFFSADDGTSGNELWVSDGTGAGTVRLMDIQPGTGASSPFSFVALGTSVFFRANDGTHGQELWTSDGTALGTVMVKDIRPGASVGSTPIDLTVAAGRVFFSADDGVHGRELWSSDGTDAGTGMVEDINPSGDSLPFLGTAAMTPLGGGLLFFADDGVHGKELWTSDGTGAGTHLLADLNAGPGASWFDGFLGPSIDRRLVTTGGVYYFRAFTDAGGIDVFVSDGTAAGTRRLKSINTQTSAFQVGFNGFALLPDHPLADLGGTLLFTATDGATGLELAASDGTPGGTGILKDLWSGSSGSAPASYTPFGGRMIFLADPGTGATLWSSDGSGPGTVRLADVAPAGSPVTDPALPTVVGSQLFVLSGGTSSLYVSDGTGAGTHAVPTTAVLPDYPTAFGGRLYFTASDAGNAQGNELWSSDGTGGGTGIVADIAAGAASSYPDRLTATPGHLFFAADDGVHGRELWATDGTPGNAHLVKDILPGAGSGMLFTGATDTTVAVGGSLFFAADDGVAGKELWTSDGTAAGTVLVMDIFPGPRSSEITQLTAVGSRVYFVADDGVHGREPWVSDGTPAGTHLVADVFPGAESSRPTELAAIDGKLLFSAFDGAHGREPWISDGTPAGTALLADIAPGPLSSSPLSFTVSGPNVYFAADDNTTGFELWAVRRTTVAGALDFYTVPPCRVFDTRSGAALDPGVARRFTVAGACGIPADAKAVAGNWTVVPHGHDGHLTTYPAFADRPPTSTVNFGPLKVRANSTLLPLGQGAVEAVAILAGGAGTVDLILDVTGYFE